MVFGYIDFSLVISTNLFTFIIIVHACVAFRRDQAHSWSVNKVAIKIRV